MNTDPQQIRAQVDAALADLPDLDAETAENGIDVIDAGSVGIDVIDAGSVGIDVIDAVGSRLEQAHQILVDALESVEKG